MHRRPDGPQSLSGRRGEGKKSLPCLESEPFARFLGGKEKGGGESIYCVDHNVRVFRPDRSQQNVKLLWSNLLTEMMAVGCVGYNRVLVKLGYPHSINPAATNAPLPIFLKHNSKVVSERHVLFSE
jgi:hypothetical protein